MKLSKYAKQLGVSYKTAWNWFKSGKIIGAYQVESGTVIVPEEKSQFLSEKIATYSRVSSSENKSNLLSQSKRVQEFCQAKGWIVSVIVEECGSGLNDNRPKLLKLLSDESITKIVVEHKDRLTRFGFNYLKTLWHGEIVVINEIIEDEKDLMQDFISLVTSFTARLYGKRRTKRATEKLIKDLKQC
jgi:predicted site-specific integrase-resolvase